MIRILIADDHAIVRAGLRQFIADQSDMQVSGEAATGNETISLVRESEFDVVLLDISMPDKNGIDTLKTLKHVRPELPVLMLMRRALFLAEERAGRSIAARAAMTATMMRSSMSVKPRRKESFIIHL